MLKKINIVWFKRDLRLIDNQALFAAASSDVPLLLVYILEPSLEEDPNYSARHFRFVFESIADLNEQLKTHFGEVIILRAEVLYAFELLANQFSIQTVFSTEESGIKITYDRDLAFAKFCKQSGIEWREYQNNGVVRGLKNRDTWRKLWYDYMAQPILSIDFSNITFLISEGLGIELPKFIFNPRAELHSMQKGGRSEGKIWEESFFDERLEFYSAYISSPSLGRYGCSRLSPYFAWGCISIREVYQRSMKLKQVSPFKKQLSAFTSRLRWQSHFIQKFEMEPRMEFEAFNKGFLSLSQPYNEEYVSAWKNGRTGYPLVDACIRAVIETGYLNFRMRALCVSFLTHHLFQHFSTGAEWLARQFLDFEPGIHYAQFQMQAGFTATNTIRIYNPTKNGLEHDSEAKFIKKWVPELASLPIDLVIEPWKITPMEKMMYNFYPGENYLLPIVAIQATRAFALKQLYGKQKEAFTKKEKKRILDVHTLKDRNL
jgi:deoxyribodipyrimidine photo-lyase